MSRTKCALWLGAWLTAACGLTQGSRQAVVGPLPTRAATPTAVVVVSVVEVVARLPTPEATASPDVSCGSLIAVCWSAADKSKVAHICYEEARGLLASGMASCASTVARRQTRPDLFGSAELDHLLRFSQFTVNAALTRPWERGLPPPSEALSAVDLFLSDNPGTGCWGYDSFRGRTPEQAQAWKLVAPGLRCVVARGSQAMIFFNWQDGF
jgi:hypothetical protein